MDEVTRVAVIDIGSTTCKLLLAEKGREKRWTYLRECATQLRLFQHLTSSGQLSEQGINSLRESLLLFRDIAEQCQVADGFVFATGFARRLNRHEQLAALVGELLGWPFEVLSAAEEARFAFLGPATLGSEGRGRRIVIDVGGATVELGCGEAARLDCWISIPTGAVQLFFSSKRELTGIGECNSLKARLSEEIRNRFGKNLELWQGVAKSQVVFATGATALIFALMDMVENGIKSSSYQADVSSSLDWYALDIARAKHLLEKVVALPLEGRRNVPGLPADRADLFPFGACILLAIADLLGIPAIIVTRRGIIFGALVARFG